MAETFLTKSLEEINMIADDPTIPKNVRQIAGAFGNKLAELDEEEAKRFVWANMNNAGLAYRTLLNYLPEEGSDIRDFVLGEQKPTYSAPDRKKIGEMFASVGGEEVLDQMSPKFFGVNKDIDRAKIRAVAKANGLTEQELWQSLQDESVKMEREKIASGEREQGWGRLGTKALGFIAPRSIDVVREGKDEKDLGGAMSLDAIENLLFMTNPVGRGMGALGTRAFGKALQNEAKRRAFNVGGEVAEAFGTPALMSVTESIAEGEPQDPTDILYQGTANIGGGRVLRQKVGRFTKNRGDIKSVQKALQGEGEKAEKQTFKEFEKDLDKAIKERKKITGDVSQREGYVSLSPKQRAKVENVKPIFSGDADLDETATQIAKIVGNKGISLEDATRIYFDKMKKSKSPAYVESVIEKFNDRKDKMFEIGEGGKIIPNQNLYNLIDKSSWGKVFTEEFAKKPRAKKQSFTKKYLLSELEGTERPDYSNWLKNRIAKTGVGMDIGKTIVGAVPFVDVDEMEKQKEQEQKAEAERKAMQKYLFGLE